MNLRESNFQEYKTQLDKAKNHSNDRILTMELIPGEKQKNAAGLTDSRLFTGGNKLHCVKNPMTNLWSFKYEQGGLPDPLKQTFTTFNKAKAFAEEYFRSRGIKITGVEDQ